MNGEAQILGRMRRSARDIVAHALASDFIHKVSETFLTRIGVIGLGFISSVITARTLGPEGRGAAGRRPHHQRHRHPVF